MSPAAAPGVVPLPELAEEEVITVARPTQGRISLVETTSSGERKVEDDEDNFATPTSPREAVEVFEETVRPPPPAAADCGKVKGGHN